MHDHTCGNQRREECSQRIARVQTPLDSICFIHDADPGAEAGVSQPISKPRDGITENQYGKWWMSRKNCVCDYMAQWSDDDDAALAKAAVNGSIGKSCERVAGKGSEKD